MVVSRKESLKKFWGESMKECRDNKNAWRILDNTREESKGIPGEINLNFLENKNQENYAEETLKFFHDKSWIEFRQEFMKKFLNKSPEESWIEIRRETLGGIVVGEYQSESLGQLQKGSLEKYLMNSFNKYVHDIKPWMMTTRNVRRNNGEITREIYYGSLKKSLVKCQEQYRKNFRH